MQPDHHSFNFLNALLAQLDQVVFAYEVESDQFIYLNPAFEHVFKLKRERLAAEALRAMVHPQDQEYVTEAYEDLLAGQNRQRLEFRLLLPHQGERWVGVKPFLLPETYGKGVMGGVMEDITDIKRYADVEQKFSNKM